MSLNISLLQGDNMHQSESVRFGGRRVCALYAAADLHSLMFDSAETIFLADYFIIMFLLEVTTYMRKKSLLHHYAVEEIVDIFKT